MWAGTDGARGPGRGAVILGALLTGMLLAGVPRAFALNPALDASQYAHMAWPIRSGFVKGTIAAIAQTPDGYLWLGTEFGLFRFDGVGALPWQPPHGQQLNNSGIRGLLVARDGTLWIGTADSFTSWNGATLTRHPQLAGQSVWTLMEDRDGTVWAGGQAATPAGKVCAIRGGSVQCFGEDGRFGRYVETLFEDRGRNLWVGSTSGLWQWRPGPPRLYPMPDRVEGLIEGDNGAVTIAMLTGIRQLMQGKSEPYLLAGAPRFSPRSFLRDRDGGLWIGTADRGVVHVHEGRTDVFGRSEGLSGDFVERLFEDREGNIWVATLDGLDRFRDLAVPKISVEQGLSNPTVESVLAARDGSMWLGTLDGLNRWDNGRVTIYRKSSGLPDAAIESLFQDSQDRIWAATRGGLAYLENGHFIRVDGVPGGVQSIAGDRAGSLWVSQKDILFHLRDRQVVERFPWTRLGRPEQSRSMIVDPTRGGLWLALRGALGYFQDGEIRTLYTPADGLGAGHIRDLELDRQGAVWASTAGGLSRLKNGRVATLTSKNGLPCDDAHWAMEDNEHALWVYMACALVRLSKPELDAWADAAKPDPRRQFHVTVFDASDGFRGHAATTGFSPSVARSADGRLWFLPWDGVSVLDPRHLPFNRLPPPVEIGQITADHKTYDAPAAGKGRLQLPPLVRDLEIDYTALSLAAPEKMLFRYRLEGRDRDWHEVGNRRQAYYGNLPPANYRFRVAACNNSGVWNEAGTYLDFAVAPKYYQTIWFLVSCVAALLLLLAALYRLRLRQVERHFNLRLDERLAERTRIAQELHDTLLQGFLSASMHVDIAADCLPPDSKAKPTLTRALQMMRQVIDEGRNAVRGLRANGSQSFDLEPAFSQVWQEMDEHGQTGFRVVVEGPPIPLHPLLCDDVYRIGREALINAFRHAHARHVEVELKYGPSELCIVVRDDGCGIDPHILEGGKAGHWGLSGIRERADRIGARLSLLSNPNAGTELQLFIPGRAAYSGQSKRRLKWFANPVPMKQK